MLWRELRETARGLTKTPRFTVISASTLALGIGGCTAIFSVFYGVMLKPLPYPEPERLVQVAQVHEKGGHMSFSDPNFEDLLAQNRGFQSLAQFAASRTSVSGGSEATRALVATVSSEFFEVLGVSPNRGRSFLPEEYARGASPTVIVSYGYWQRYLGGNEDLSSVPLRFSHRTHMVVGVMPSDFHFPAEAELWIPRGLAPRWESRTAHNWRAIGRLGANVGLRQARADATAIAKTLKQQYGDDTWMADVALTPLREQLVGDRLPALSLLMGAVGLLWLIACANVANLLLTRASSRRNELALRRALGASRFTLVRHFLTEALMVSLLGGVFGALIAHAGVGFLLAFEKGKLPRAEEIGTGELVLLFCLGLTLVSTAGLGLLTAAQSLRTDLRSSLHANQRSESHSAGRFRRSLVSGQVAVTLILVVGAGLLGRSLLRLHAVDPGFRTAGRLVMEIEQPSPRDDSEKRRLGISTDVLLSEIRAITSVRQAGAVDRLPFATGSRNGMFLEMQAGDVIEDYEAFGRLMEDPTRVGQAEYRAASSQYFEVMGIRLMRGRKFGSTDGPDTLPVALVSSSLVERQWPNSDPLGKLIQFGNMDGDLRNLTVVGVVSDVHDRGLDAEPVPTIYTNLSQRPRANVAIVMELASRDSTASVESLRTLLRTVSPDVAPRFRTIEQVVGRSVSDRRFVLLLVVAFGAAALALASIGIYGVASYTVTQRTREIGIRMALGARPREVVGLVVSQGGRSIAIGVSIGIIGALASSRILHSFLFGVTATDPWTYVGGVAVLAGFGLLACYAPARRAARLDPTLSLRYD